MFLKFIVSFKYTEKNKCKYFSKSIKNYNNKRLNTQIIKKSKSFFGFKLFLKTNLYNYLSYCCFSNDRRELFPNFQSKFRNNS